MLLISLLGMVLLFLPLKNSWAAAAQLLAASLLCARGVVGMLGFWSGASQRLERDLLLQRGPKELIWLGQKMIPAMLHYYGVFVLVFVGALALAGALVFSRLSGIHRADLPISLCLLSFCLAAVLGGVLLALASHHRLYDFVGLFAPLARCSVQILILPMMCFGTVLRLRWKWLQDRPRRVLEHMEQQAA